MQVRLVGTRSNRDGIGARVTLHAGGRTQVREIRRNTGYAGSTLPVAHFGLAKSRRVDRLEIRWPEGKIDTRENLEVNQVVEITED